MRTEFYKLIKTTFIVAFGFLIASIIFGLFVRDIIIDFYIDVPYEIYKDVELVTTLNFAYVIFFGAVLPVLFSLMMFVFRHDLSIGTIKRLKIAFNYIYLGAGILLFYAVYVDLYSIYCLIGNENVTMEVIESGKFGGNYLIGFIIKTFGNLFIGIGIVWSMLQLWLSIKKIVKQSKYS